MILASRPIRFFLVTLGGWIGLRAMMLWPAAILPPLARAIVPPAEAERVAATPGAPIALQTRDRFADALAPLVFAHDDADPEPSQADAHATVAVAGATAFAPPGQPSSPQPGADPPPAFGDGRRWSVSAWAILRPGGSATPFTSQLGGSQAGARIAYAVDRDRRIAVYTRVSSAIDTVQREAAIGVDWRPTRLPIHLIAERRIGIEGARGGSTVGVVGGFGPDEITAGVRAEAYGQAGVIFRDGREAFVDGALRVTKPVAPRVDLGLGAWGGAQRGATRLDVGPTLGVSLPVDAHAIRLSLDWRQRIAGDARPGSGPAVSMGVDF